MRYGPYFILLQMNVQFSQHSFLNRIHFLYVFFDIVKTYSWSCFGFFLGSFSLLYPIGLYVVIFRPFKVTSICVIKRLQNPDGVARVLSTLLSLFRHVAFSVQSLPTTSDVTYLVHPGFTITFHCISQEHGNCKHCCLWIQAS